MQFLLKIFLVGTKTYKIYLIYILLPEVKFPAPFGAEAEGRGGVCMVLDMGIEWNNKATWKTVGMETGQRVFLCKLTD